MTFTPHNTAMPEGLTFSYIMLRIEHQQLCFSVLAECLTAMEF